MKPLMLITGPVATRSGYGSHSRDLTRALISMDKFDIKINSMRWGNTPMNVLNDKDPMDKIILDRIMKGELGGHEFDNNELRVTLASLVPEYKPSDELQVPVILRVKPDVMA